MLWLKVLENLLRNFSMALKLKNKNPYLNYKIYLFSPSFNNKPRTIFCFLYLNK
jgi:hypothetical protein